MRRISEPVSMVGSGIYSGIGSNGSQFDGGRPLAQRTQKKILSDRFAPRNDKYHGGAALGATPKGVELGKALLRLRLVVDLVADLLRLVPCILRACLHRTASLLGNFLSAFRSVFGYHFRFVAGCFGALLRILANAGSGLSAVSFRALFVGKPVLSAAFSVPFAVSLATTLVSCPVFSAPFFTSVAAS